MNPVSEQNLNETLSSVSSLFLLVTPDFIMILNPLSYEFDAPTQNHHPLNILSASQLLKSLDFTLLAFHRGPEILTFKHFNDLK